MASAVQVFLADGPYLACIAWLRSMKRFVNASGVAAGPPL